MDTGATKNLVYETILQKPPPFMFLISTTPAEHLYTVTAAFGERKHCSTIASLKITFEPDKFIIDDFLIIPDDTSDSRIILGKPLLHLLRYRLDEKFQYITINNTEIKLMDYNILFNAHQIHDSLLNKYLQKYPQLFSNATSKTPAHGFKYKVMLKNFNYNLPRPFYANPIQAKQIKSFIDDALENNVIKEITDDSCLPALAPVFPIQQQHKTRVVTDFRAINRSLIYQPDIIPPINLIIQNLAKYKTFSTLDLKSAYYNVPLDSTGHKIGITTIYGNFEFLKLPFGLASSPAVFTRFMRYILRNLKYDKENNFIQCYLDDIIISSTNQHHHLVALENLFQLLSHYDLRLTTKKIILASDSIEFLGYVIKDGKRLPSPSKTSAIDNWKIPTTAKEWYSFIGFVNFLNNFIPNSAFLLQPLYKHYYHLLKKETSTIPLTTLHENFKLLKIAIKETVGLQLFDPKQPTYIMTDASETGVGGIILQPFLSDSTKLVPITFFSKCFNQTQQRYSTLERELFGILLALKHNYLLLSTKIIILTDHQALISITNKSSMLNTRIMKFLETLTTYPITIKYIPGKKNHADFLSRFHVNQQPCLSSDDFSTTFLQITFATFPTMIHITDEILSSIKQSLIDQTPFPEDHKKLSTYFILHENTLFIILQDQLFKILTFQECRSEFIQQHNKYHGSTIVLLDIMIANSTFHPQAKLIAIDVVKNCPNCDLFSRFQDIPPPLQPIKTPQLGELWHIDFMGPLSSADPSPQLYLSTCKYILITVEYVSGYCIALPTINMTSATICKFLTQLFTFFPLPKSILSDNALNFISEETQSFIQDFGIQWQKTSTYYPQSNSRVERVNGLIKKLIKQLDPSFNSWPFQIFQAIHTYNNTTTIYDTSPAELMFGFKAFTHFPISSIEKMIHEHIKEFPYQITENDAIILRLYQLQSNQELRNKLTDKKHVARSHLKLLNDPKQNHNTFTVGEYVFLKKMAKHKKTDPSYEGPFIISQCLDKNTYKLHDLLDRTLPGTHNLSHLRPCFQHYGSPFQTIADFTTNFGDRQQQLYLDTFSPPD